MLRQPNLGPGPSVLLKSIRGQSGSSLATASVPGGEINGVAAPNIGQEEVPENSTAGVQGQHLRSVEMKG